jgi:hypothetical protein
MILLVDKTVSTPLDRFNEETIKRINTVSMTSIYTLLFKANSERLSGDFLLIW